MYFTVYPLSSNGKTSRVCATELIFLLCEYDANIIARVMLINIASVERAAPVKRSVNGSLTVAPNQNPSMKLIFGY